ncbi:hypothetical protein ACFQXA_18575 [Nocardiopsis composta]
MTSAPKGKGENTIELTVWESPLRSHRLRDRPRVADRSPIAVRDR